MTIPTPSPANYLDDGGAADAAVGTGYGQVAGAPASYYIGASATSWNGVVVVNVTAINESAGDETYSLVVEGSVDASFAKPVAVASLSSVAAVGQYLIPVYAYFQGVLYPYLRIAKHLGGTAPSLTLNAFPMPFSGMDALALPDLIKVYGVVSQNLQALSSAMLGWATGTATGGPNSDGRYPLYDAAGDSFLATSWAAYAATIKGEPGPPGEPGPAGTTTWSGLSGIPSALTIGPDGFLEGTNIAWFPGGPTLSTLQPAQAGADVTQQNTAAGIVGQSPLATSSSYEYVTNVPAALLTDPNGNLSTSFMAYPSGVVVSNLQPAQADADQTSQNTAAAIAGQGQFATYQGYSPGQVVSPGANLVNNPCGASALAGWVSAQIGNWGSGNNSSIYGSYLYCNTPFASQAVDPSLYSSAAIGAAPNNPLSLSAQVYAGNLENGYARVAVVFYNAAGTYLSESDIYVLGGTAGWNYYKLENILPPANTASCKIRLDTTNTPVNSQFGTTGSYAVTQIKLEAGAVATPFNNLGTYSAAYNDYTTVDALRPAQASADKTSSNTAAGIAGQSAWATLTATPPAAVITARKNMVYNPTGSLALAGWTDAIGPFGASQRTNGGDGPYLYTTSATSGVGASLQQHLPVFPNSAYSLQAEIYTGGLQLTGGTVAQGRAYLAWYNSAGTFLSYSNVLAVTSGQGWIFVSSDAGGAFQSPATAASCTLVLDIWSDGSWDNPSTGSITVAWRYVKLENSPYCTVYSDDATNGAAYNDNTVVDSLRPNQVGADQTGLNTAAGIAGQSLLATNPSASNLYYGNGVSAESLQPANPGATANSFMPVQVNSPGSYAAGVGAYGLVLSEGPFNVPNLGRSVTWIVQFSTDITASNCQYNFRVVLRSGSTSGAVVDTIYQGGTESQTGPVAPNMIIYGSTVTGNNLYLCLELEAAQIPSGTICNGSGANLSAFLAV